MADPDSRRGERYITADLLSWLEDLHVPHDAALAQAFEAPERHGMPPIQVGRSEGRLLGLLLRLVDARKVVEFGTLAGYSAVHMARALPQEGRLWSLESDERHAEIARRNVEAAGLAQQIRILVGPALEHLITLGELGPFDAVFLDADKGNYDRYGRWAARHLRSGGLLLADNAYFFGQLLESNPEAEAMRRFHREACQSFDTVCIPTPDGMLLGIKR